MMGIVDEERRRELNDIKALMETAQGRRVIWRILGLGHIFDSTFSDDALRMAAAEGERNVALKILADVTEIAPKRFQIMMLEGNERREMIEKARARERQEEGIYE